MATHILVAYFLKLHVEEIEDTWLGSNENG